MGARVSPILLLSCSSLVPLHRLPVRPIRSRIDSLPTPGFCACPWMHTVCIRGSSPAQLELACCVSEATASQVTVMGLPAPSYTEHLCIPLRQTRLLHGNTLQYSHVGEGIFPTGYCILTATEPAAVRIPKQWLHLIDTVQLTTSTLLWQVSLKMPATHGLNCLLCLLYWTNGVAKQTAEKPCCWRTWSTAVDIWIHQQ